MDFVYSLSEYLLSIYYMPRMTLGVREMALNKIYMNKYSQGAYLLAGESPYQ